VSPTGPSEQASDAPMLADARAGNVTHYVTFSPSEAGPERGGVSPKGPSEQASDASMAADAPVGMSRNT
jgi:hypothetical protein